MIFLETVARRWYAFAFVGVLLWSASAEGGWRRALRFLAVSFAVQLAAELSSTRTGIPFGRYAYTAATHGKEAYVSNVPLFVPLSFGSVVWAGRALARASLRARGAALAIAGAVGAATLDLLIDPMTLRGDGWFLGRLYAYESPGPYFGVPWSNVLGWVAVSAVILIADSALDAVTRGAREGAGREGAGSLGGSGAAGSPRPRRSLALPCAIAGFFLALALASGQWAIAGANAAISLVLAGVVAVRLRTAARA